MAELIAPPQVVAMARVIAYAAIDESVRWTGRQTLFVGGVELGPVPRLILAQNMGSDLTDILIFHCNETWEVLGISGADNIENAKAKAERAYSGISDKWVETNTSPEQARAWIDEHHADAICSFCGRLPTEYEQLVSGKSSTICNKCVDEMYAEIHHPAGEGNAI